MEVQEREKLLEQDAKLILEVEKYPVLYNSTILEYRDRNKRLLIWNEIGLAVGLTAQDCERRWRSLRDRYVRERRKRKPGKSGSTGGKGIIAWQFMPLMEFLDGFVLERRTAGNSLEAASNSLEAPSSQGVIILLSASSSVQSPVDSRLSTDIHAVSLASTALQDKSHSRSSVKLEAVGNQAPTVVPSILQSPENSLLSVDMQASSASASPCGASPMEDGATSRGSTPVPNGDVVFIDEEGDTFLPLPTSTSSPNCRTAPESTETAWARSKRKHVEASEFILKMLRETDRAPDRKQLNSVELFLLSLADRVLALNPAKRLKFEVKTLQLLHELSEEKSVP